ncbi:MAG: hypothetical protein AAGA77_13665 [Bacteroidota bacterium]
METLGALLGALFGLILFLYILTYIGMGIVQPIGAICRLASTRRKSSLYAIGLKRYLIGVFIYFLGLYSLIQLEAQTLSDFKIFYLYVIPWAFAIWYIRHIRLWKKKFKNIKEFDREKLLNASHKDRLLLDTYPRKKVLWNNPIKPKLTIKETTSAIIRPLHILNTIN